MIPSPSSLRALVPNKNLGSLPLFDHKGWKRLPFGAFAESIGERAEPKDAQEEIYVGLEHLDPQCLHIRRWGKGSDVTGTKLRFRKGEIIFGRRRAYQRKLAVAEFDGICSAHAMVVRARPDKVLPEFLPFLMMSDRFMNRAVEISVGSLSPTINWTTLKLEEFDLPPLDQQRRIAEILWAVDEVIEKYRELLASSGLYEEAFVRGRMGQQAAVIENLSMRREYEGDGWLVATGQSLLDRGILEALKDGNHGEQYPRSSEFSKTGTPYVAASNVSDDGKIDFDGCPKLTDDVKTRLRIPLARGGDVLLTHNATVGRVAIIPDSRTEVVASTTTTYYRPNTAKLSIRYLAAYLRTHLFQAQLHRVMKQSTRDQVPITAQKKLLFVIPPLAFQETFVREVGEVQQSITSAAHHLAASRQLSQQLTNAVTNS